MESEVARIERRLQDWALTSERNRDARNQKADLIARRQQEAAAFENERATRETGLLAIQEQLDQLRNRREELQHAAATASTALAGLEERRRNAAANFQEQTNRIYQHARSSESNNSTNSLLLLSLKSFAVKKRRLLSRSSRLNSPNFAPPQ